MPRLTVYLKTKLYHLSIHMFGFRFMHIQGAGRGQTRLSTIDLHLNPLTLREAKTDLRIWEILYFKKHTPEKFDGEMFL